MPKKIYDIKPPKVGRKAEKEIKEFLAVDTKKKQHHRRKKEAHFPWKTFSAVAGTAVIILVVFLYFKLQKADIQIWPKVDVLSYEQAITADQTADAIDLSKNIIPVQYFEEEKTGSQEFPATGNASNEGQASGTITVYNKYNPPAPITLKAGTHFLSDSGKYFITLQKIVIPAGKKSGSKITPGSVQVKVQAVEGGENYNIGPAAFSVPKLSGTDYYYSIYAQSTEAMSGGYAGEIKKVTDDDIAQAKDVLTKKLIVEAQDSIKGKISADYILLDSPDSFDVTSASTQTKSGTTAENFTYQATVKANVLAIKKSDLDEFAKEYIIAQMPEQKTMLDSSFKIDYAVKSVEIDKGTATIDLSFSSGTYQSIDKNSLSLLLTNKNGSQISETINNNLGDSISNIKIKFWPFWVTKTPKNQKAVKIELKF
jgi:hypothetical protein